MLPNVAFGLSRAEPQVQATLPLLAEEAMQGSYCTPSISSKLYQSGQLRASQFKSYSRIHPFWPLQK